VVPSIVKDCRFCPPSVSCEGNVILITVAAGNVKVGWILNVYVALALTMLDDEVKTTDFIVIYVAVITNPDDNWSTTLWSSM